jgi:N-acetylneuraminate 9-O-acetyltransferase
MLFRLNFLVFFVCLALNKEYMLYYICPLHTFVFLTVYTIMAIKPDANGYSGPAPLLLKVGLVIVLFVLIFDVPQTGMFEVRPSPPFSLGRRRH